MEKLTIQILDKKAIKKLQDLVNKKLIEIKQETSTEIVDWASFAGSLPKMSISEVEVELKLLRK
jgi:hypothetical protein